MSTRPTIASNMLYEPGHFPDLLRRSIDGRSDGVQPGARRHAKDRSTSGLIMSRFVGTRCTTRTDMRSHQASTTMMHDRAHREFKKITSCSGGGGTQFRICSISSRRG
jgi:hypothetical protein